MAKLTDISVDFISLVRKGANKKEVIFKSADAGEQELKTVNIAKTDEEKRIVYGIVYAPDEVDTQGDFAEAADIEKAAYDFMAQLNGRNIDKGHSYVPENAFVAESWLIRKGDPLFPDEPEGAWAVGIKVEDDALWEEVKKGEISGLSMGGTAIKKAADFKTVSATDNIWKHVDNLGYVIRGVIEDETVTDKMAAIDESLSQFRDVLAGNIEKQDKGGLLAAIVNKLTGGQEMKKEDVEQIVKTAIDGLREELKKGDANEPNDGGDNGGGAGDTSGADVAEAVKKAIEPLVARIEAIEKSSGGSGQPDSDDGDNGDGIADTGAQYI